jgi:hypothetical protein
MTAGTFTQSMGRISTTKFEAPNDGHEALHKELSSGQPLPSGAPRNLRVNRFHIGFELWKQIGLVGL